MSHIQENNPFTIALAGNPNCGKTTIFNALTGSNQHVGNYSGVTVEKRDGKFKYDGHEVTVVDLPGTYSLNYHSPEERIAQEELLSGNVDLLVAIVDAGALSRSLLFVAQLMQLHLPMILCLNMWDEAEKAGLQLNISAMKGLLGMPVIKTVASKGQGIEELKAAIFDHDNWQVPEKRLRLGDTISATLDRIKNVLPESYKVNADWVATKLLLGDAKYSEEIAKLEDGKAILKLATDEKKHIEADSKMDIQLYVTEQYYGFVDGMLKEVTINEQRADARAMSDKIDKVLVHPILGIPIFLFIVYLLFQFTFSLGQYPMDWIEAGFDMLADLCRDHMNDGLLKSLIVDGIIGGVGGVIVFLPNILILFLGLSFLEDSGYMARSAFLMDKLMHKVGLHGRSFIPLITGFGCTVPGLMATRTIAGEKERLTTMYILPLMSCGARLPIWLLLVPVFFPKAWQAPAMMGIYLLGVIIALIAAMCLRKTLFKGQEEPFVMELPPYRMPTLRATVTHMLERAWMYLKKAGTIILGVSIVLWALAVWHPGGFDKDNAEAEAVAAIQNDEAFKAEIAELAPSTSFEDFMAEAQAAADEAADKEDDEEEGDADEKELTPEEKLNDLQLRVIAKKDALVAEADLGSSALAAIGRTIAPVLSPMGFDWKISTAVLGAFAAKEVFVAQMGIVYKLGEVDENSDTLRDTLRATYPLSTGIPLIIWLLISSPCMATFAVMKRESGSWKHAFAQFGGLTLLAYVLATIVHFVSLLFS